MCNVYIGICYSLSVGICTSMRVVRRPQLGKVASQNTRTRLASIQVGFSKLLVY